MLNLKWSVVKQLIYDIVGKILQNEIFKFFFNFFFFFCKLWGNPEIFWIEVTGVKRVNLQFLQIYLYFSAVTFDQGWIICILVCMKTCKACQVSTLCIGILWNPFYMAAFLWKFKFYSNFEPVFIFKMYGFQLLLFLIIGVIVSPPSRGNSTSI